MITFGRRRIFADCDEINASNVEKIIAEALTVHQKNALEIGFLRKYSKGNQPVLRRKKKVRADITNKVVVNIAAEVLDFKLSYIFGAPVDIVRPADSKTKVDIGPLQRMMAEQGKDDIDQEIAMDFCIGGLGYRCIMPNKNGDETSPFRMAEMLPETTFCIYKNDIFKTKLAGVSFIVQTDGKVTFTVFTKKHRFELRSDAAAGPKLTKTELNGIGEIPIVEYSMPEGMGVFEKAISKMDAYNTATSNRIDDVEQFIQSILAVFGVDLTEEDLVKLNKSLCLIVPDIREGVTPEAKYLVNNLDQSGVQAIMDDLYYHILEVCGVPGREQSSGGNTGAATEMGAGGWRKVQYSAERIIAAWKKGDRDMYRVILSILKKSSKPEAIKLKDLKITDLESKFTLSKSNNVLSKSQGMLNQMQAGIHPRIAIRESDLFSDPEQVYEESKPYIDKALERMGNKKAEETGGSTGGSKESGDVTNQPKGDDGINKSAEGKANVQKPD